MTTGTTVHACWRWFTAHCHLMSSLGPLDDGPPSLANQPAQPPVQPVQPWAKSLECHVLARDMTCSPDFCSCLFILGLWSSRRAFRLLLYRLWDLYIYNEMLQPDCNNLPNALPGALHCRWICPGKEGTCEPPVIDSWKSKSMSSTSCTWFANVKFAVMSMAYDGLPCAWNRVQVLGSANPSDIIPQSSILIMRTIIHSPEVWLRRFDRKNGWPSHANDKEL